MGNFHLFCEVALRIMKHFIVHTNEETGFKKFSSGSSSLVVIPSETGRLKPGCSSRYGRDPTADTTWFIRKLRNLATCKALDLCGFASHPEESLMSYSEQWKSPREKACYKISSI